MQARHLGVFLKENFAFNIYFHCSMPLILNLILTPPNLRSLPAQASLLSEEIL
jgi:hypothetical protein